MCGVHLIAGERIPCETSPVKIPQRHFTGEGFPQRQVAGESGKSSPGKILIVVVDMFVDYEPLSGYVGVVGFGTVMLPLTIGK
ncbi:hypothetical protein Tco_0467110, partial [Tanacetum coccineum]